MVDKFVKKYEAARRDLLALWTAKRNLLQVGQSRFPKSHPAFKAILRLCHNDSTCQIRHLCDVSACRCADQCGDALFRKEVDGVLIPAVTHWFYGITYLLPQEKVTLNRTKQFNASDIELFEEVYRLGRKFINSAAALPFLPKAFTQETKRFEQTLARAQAQVEKSSPIYAAYLHLQDKVPQSIADNIVALI